MAKYLGFDLGSKTIGIAKSDGFIANPLITIRFEEYDFLDSIKKLEPILQAENPSTIVIGWPVNMNGTIGPRVDMVQEFLDLFTISYPNLIIEKVDERLTTRMAKSIMIEADLSRKKQKANKDTLAAILILESFLSNNNR